MLSTRVRIAVACGAVALLGGACGGGDGETTKASTPSVVEADTQTTVTAATEATEAEAPRTAQATPTAPRPTTVAGSTTPAPATPSAEEVQALITSMNAQLMQAAATGPDTPAPTSDEIEAQLLEQLRQLGIPL